jgi:uncharacterized RDD family membrane protein YckC
MPCSLCGDICRCSHDPDSAVPPRWLADDDACLAVALPQGDPPAQEVASLNPSSSVDAGSSGDAADPAPEDSPAWRKEVAARLNRYQSRRKPRPPRYPSLRLRFEEQETIPNTTAGPGPLSHAALALDGFADSLVADVEVPKSECLAPAESHDLQPGAGLIRPGDSFQPPATSTLPTARIIEFPRSWVPAPAPLDELAEPVLDRPRILEAPEIILPPPALGGITIEPALQPDLEKRPGIDIPLQSAPLSRRVFSAAIDGVIIASACGLFGFIFWKMTAIQPPRFQIAGFAAGLLGLFWAAYQYLLVVYSGSTPGLRLARLELARFDGNPAGRRLRRWRVLAGLLSAVSLGMGYAWVFLDEDSLCWHDRITHTYLAPKNSK